MAPSCDGGMKTVREEESSGEERRTESEEEEIGTLCNHRKAMGSFNVPH